MEENKTGFGGMGTTARGLGLVTACQMTMEKPHPCSPLREQRLVGGEGVR